MAARVLLALLLAASVRGCVVYEYEHEIWLRVDGSGTVNVTGRPELWRAFKGVALPPDTDEDGLRAQARAAFERSGLTVKRVTVTHRGGRPYLFVSAEFRDVNVIGGTPAFPDLTLSMHREGDNLRLKGHWARPPGATAAPRQTDGVMAVRFHLPSKVYGHGNAMDGVERGNIVGWRQDVGAALAGRALEDMWALIDSRSILRSTVALFGLAIAVAFGIISAALYWVLRRGQSRAAAA
jgi:hypothetical protein